MMQKRIMYYDRFPNRVVLVFFLLMVLVGLSAFIYSIHIASAERMKIKKAQFSIRSGMHKSEVLRRLGPPNSIGDTYKFDGKILNMRSDYVLSPQSVEIYIWYLEDIAVYALGFNKKGIVTNKVVTSKKGTDPYR